MLGSVLTQWGEWQRSANLSQRTITERAAVLRRFLTWCGKDPFSFTAQDIIAYLERPALKPGTRCTYHEYLRNYGDWLVRTHQAATNPADGTPAPKRRKGVPRPITPAQLQAVLDVAKHRRTRMMFLLAAFQGLRVHEIAKIRGEDFDLDAGVLYVTGKGGTTAMLPVHELVAAEAASFPRIDWWFPSYRNAGPIHRTAVSKTIHDALARAGVHATPHQLRHFYGTELVRNGVSLRVVQELMRHSSLATTQIYTLVDEAQLRAGLDTLHLPDAA